MPQLIKEGRLIDNPWVIVPREESLEECLARPEPQLIVPAQLWLDNAEALRASGKQFGIWLDSDQHPELIETEIPKFDLIALNFPKFTDGRAFSYAVVLRTRYGYQGELRAIGEVLRDPLFYMKRCGFDAFDVVDEVKLEDALKAFSDFHDTYASSVEQPVPLFRRRFAQPSA